MLAQGDIEVAAPTRPGLILDGVRAAYGDVVALDGVSLRAAEGEVVAVVGPSGCGKSTLLDLVCGLAGASRAQARAAAAEHFTAFGLRGFERTRPAELSGGMRQRVAFLRTLLAGRPVLCLDEPFGALDALTRAQMQDWLADTLEREPRTVLLVTHDVEEAVLLADRVVLLSPRPGRVVAELPVEAARPRRRADPELVALRERAMAELRAVPA